MANKRFVDKKRNKAVEIVALKETVGTADIWSIFLVCIRSQYKFFFAECFITLILVASRFIYVDIAFKNYFLTVNLQKPTVKKDDFDVTLSEDERKNMGKRLMLEEDRK